MNWFAIGYACFSLVTGGQACMTIEDLMVQDGYETPAECVARTQEMTRDLVTRGASVHPQFRETTKVKTYCAQGEEKRQRQLDNIERFLSEGVGTEPSQGI